MPLNAAIRATYVVFAACGLLLASWVARIPQLRDHLHLSPAGLGWVLLGAAAGSLVSRPFSGPVLARLGQRRTVAAAAVVTGGGLVVTGLADLPGPAAGRFVLVAGLLVIGFAMSVWDVAMNVQGAEVERRIGRSVMPRFHAAFAAGTVAGAAVAAAFVALHVPVAAHLTAVALLVIVAVPVAARDYLAEPPAPPGNRRHPVGVRCGRGGNRAPSSSGCSCSRSRSARAPPATGSPSRSSTTTAPPPRSAASATPSTWPRRPPCAGSAVACSTATAGSPSCVPWAPSRSPACCCSSSAPTWPPPSPARCCGASAPRSATRSG